MISKHVSPESDDGLCGFTKRELFDYANNDLDPARAEELRLALLNNEGLRNRANFFGLFAVDTNEDKESEELEA